MATPLLTAGDVARQLGVKPERVYAAIQAKQLAASNIGSGRRPTWRVRQFDVDAYLERVRQGPMPAATPGKPVIALSRRRIKSREAVST